MALGSISMRKTREFLVSPLMESPESKAWEESIYIFQLIGSAGRPSFSFVCLMSLPTQSEFE